MLDLTHVIYMDTTALAAIETLHDRLEKREHALILYGAPEQPARVLQSLHPVLGEENILKDRDTAFLRARTILGETVPSGPHPADRRAHS